jgi:glycosyltransferase involved in cell wall biosynthesis
MIPQLRGFEMTSSITMINPCIVIPIYNHQATIASVLDQLAPFGLPCIIVDDGSDIATRHVLEEQDKHHPWVQVLHLPRRRGKGEAVKTGLLRAHEIGYSHALQIDADGQHDVRDIPRFLAEAGAYPEALVLGEPTFSGDAPRSRRLGRRLSQFWVWVETLSLAIADPLLGFRVYPVPKVVALIQQQHLGSYMDFDPEVAVRLYWRGVPIRNVVTAVIYPQDGSSHFRLVRDNVRLVWLYIRLFFGMLYRAPGLLRRERST